MFNPKRLIAVVAAFAISLSYVVTSAPFTSAGTFADVPSSSAFYSYVEQLASAGVVSSANSSYNPTGNTTRGELAKMVVNASGVSLDSSAGPSFGDVPSSNVFYNYVETARANGWISGYGDGTFRTNNFVTRAEAMKIIVNSLGIPLQNPSSPSFADVPKSNVFFSFIEGGRAASLASPNAFYRPNDLITRQEIAKLVAVAMTYEPAAEQPEIPVASGNTLTVNVSRATPAAQTIPNNGNNIVFLTVDMTAGAVEDVEVRGLTVSLLGLGDDDDFSSVKIFDGVKQLGSDKTFASEEDVARFNLNVEPIVVPAGTTKSIDIRADLDGSSSVGNENYFTVISPDDVEAYGATSQGRVGVTGSFPIVGNTMTIGNISVAQLNFDELNLSDKTAEIGESGVVVTKFKMNVDGGTGDEDVLLQALTLEQKGSAKVDEVVNVSLWIGNEQVGETIPTLDAKDQVTFNLTGLPDGGLLLRDGESRIFRVKADMIDGITSTVYFELDESSDVIAVGTTYGFGVYICETTASSFCTDDSGAARTTLWDNTTSDNYVAIEGGDLSFAFFSVADTVANDIEDYSFGTLRVTNSGEPITIEELSLVLNIDNTNGAASADMTDITDVKLVGPSGTVTGPVDPSSSTVAAAATGTQTLNFPDDFDIASGTTVEYTLQADIEQTAPAGAKYYFAISNPSTDIKTEGIVSGDNDQANITPASQIKTQPQTIEAAGLTINKIARGDDSFVADANDIELMRFTARAGDSEAITVTDISFNIVSPDGEATADDIQNAAIYVSYDGGNNMRLKESGVNPASADTATSSGSVTFNDLDADGFAGIALAAGEEAVIVVKADIAGDLGTCTNGCELNLEITSSDLTAEDSDFDNLDSSQITVVGTTLEGPKMTLVDAGTLTIESTSQTPDQALVIAGSENVAFSAFTIEADYEKIDIDDMEITILGGFGGSSSYPNTTVDNVSLWYADGSPVKFDNGQNAQLSGITKDGSSTTLNSSTVYSGSVTFTDLNLVAEDGVEETVVVKASLATVGDDGNDTAVSGANVKVGLADKSDIVAKGFSSGEQLATANITSDDYTFASDVNTMQVVGAYPIFTLHAESKSTVAGGNRQEVMRFVVSNPANESDSKIYLKALEIDTELTDGDTSSASELEISNYVLRDDNDVTISNCAWADQRATASYTGNATTIMPVICNLDSNYQAEANSGQLASTSAGVQVDPNSSETLYLTVDVSTNFELDKDSLLFKIPSFGTPASSTGSATGADALFEGYAGGTGSTFGSGDSADRHSVIWYDQEGSTLLHYLDADTIDFRSLRLTGF